MQEGGLPFYIGLPGVLIYMYIEIFFKHRSIRNSEWNLFAPMCEGIRLRGLSVSLVLAVG